MYALAVLLRESGFARQSVYRLVACGALPRARGRSGQKGPRWGPEHLAALRSYRAFCEGRSRRRDPATGRFVSYRCEAEFCERQRRARAG